MDSAVQKPGGSAPANLDRVRMVIYARDLARTPVLGELIAQAQAQDGRVEYDVVPDPKQIPAAVAKSNLTILIVSVQAGDPVPELLGSLSQIQPRAQAGLLRVVALNAIDHPRVLMLLKANGVSDIVEPGLTIKALNLRIKNALLFVTQTYQRLKNQKVKTSAAIGGGEAGAKSAARTEGGSDILWARAPEHPCDHWWIPSARNIRFVMGRWLIDLHGPSSAVALWTATELERDGEPGWEWKPRPGADPAFASKPGRWICYGKQPEFVWQKNVWSFVSKSPLLAFVPEGETTPEYSRFELVNGQLKVFENSDSARAFLPLIQASFEASMKVAKIDGDGQVRAPVTSHAAPPSKESGDYRKGDLSRDEEPGGTLQTRSLGDGPRAKDYRKGDLSRDGDRPAYGKGDLSRDSEGEGYRKGDLSADQQGQAYRKGDLSAEQGQAYRKGDLSAEQGQAYRKGDLSAEEGQVYEKGDLSVQEGSAYEKGDLSAQEGDPMRKGDLSAEESPAYRKGDLSAGEGRGHDSGDLSPAKVRRLGSGAKKRQPDRPLHALAGGASETEPSAKDLRIDEARPPPKERGALVPDEKVATELGLEEVRQIGVSTGAGTFERVTLIMWLTKREGSEIAGKPRLQVMDLTAEHGSFQLARELAVEGNHYDIRVEFRLADVEKKIGLRWLCENVLPIEETADGIAHGRFVDGDFEELREIVQRMERRHLELRDFFLMAKGA